MSKQTILACDGSHPSVVPAVGTVDLCKHCQAAFKQFIRNGTRSVAKAMESPTERRKRKDRERHARKREEKKQTLSTRGDYWSVAEAKVMAIVRELKEQIHINDVVKRAGISHTTVATALRRLVAARKIEARGGKGRWRRYWLPA